MAKTIASGVGMTNDWLASQGVLSLKTSLVQTAQKHMIGENQRNQMRWSKGSIPQSRWGLHHVRAILEYRGSGHQITKQLQCMRHWQVCKSSQ